MKGQILNIYNSQRIHNLAIEYFNNTFNNDINSFVSPEIMNILNMSERAPPTISYRKDGTTSYDMNKFYANILKSCDVFGWAKFEAHDEVKVFDGNIETGLYFVYFETEEDKIKRDGFNSWDDFAQYKMKELNLKNKKIILIFLMN